MAPLRASTTKSECYQTILRLSYLRCYGNCPLSQLGTAPGTRITPQILLRRRKGSVAESMGRIVGEVPLPVEESESGTVLRGMPVPASGTPSPNPWDLSLSRQNVCSTLKELERRIGLRRDATRAPI